MSLYPSPLSGYALDEEFRFRSRDLNDYGNHVISKLFLTLKTVRQITVGLYKIRLTTKFGSALLPRYVRRDGGKRRCPDI